MTVLTLGDRPAAAREAIPEHEAHVWYCWTNKCCSAHARAYYYLLLSGDERERYRRLVFDETRREFLITRALCRLTLSRYADVLPGEWVFRATAYGRPEIDTAVIDTPLKFNLSNSYDMVACVVTSGTDAGIDVEAMQRTLDPLDLAPAVFSASELRSLRSLPKGEQRRRFFELWTLKESYLKARGLGLNVPLQRFSLAVGNGRIGIEFAKELNDAPDAWQFWLSYPSANHVLALGLRKRGGSDLAIKIRETTLTFDRSGSLR